MLDDFHNPAAIATAQAERSQTDKELDYRQRQQARDARTSLAITIIQRVRNARVRGVDFNTPDGQQRLAAADREALRVLAEHGLSWDDCNFHTV